MGKHDGSQIRKSIEDVKASSKVLYFWRGGNWGSNNIISNRQNKLLPDSLMSRKEPPGSTDCPDFLIWHVGAWSTVPAGSPGTSACLRSSPCDHRWERGPGGHNIKVSETFPPQAGMTPSAPLQGTVSSTCQARSDRLAVITDGLVLFLQHAEVCNVPRLWF